MILSGDKLNEFKFENDGLFIDWLTIWQVHPSHSPINSGCIRTIDGNGSIVFERHRAARIQGSYSSSCSVKSDGSCVVFSGNFGRFNRSDNLFNYDPLQTIERANIVAEFAGFPPFRIHDLRDDAATPKDFGTSVGHSHAAFREAEARMSFVNLSRVDLTKNYSCGSLGAARSVIRAIQGKSVSRVKKGIGGDSSVWWSNTRYMLKVYIKALEMEAHGVNSGKVYEYARDNGIIRLELELKRRELHDLGWNDYAQFLKGWDMGNVHKLFADYEKIMNTTAISNDAEFLDALPVRLRPLASVFLSGNDVRALVSRATFFRYRKALLEYGIDIADERPTRLNVHVQTVEVVPVVAPEWYWRAA